MLLSSSKDGEAKRRMISEPWNLPSHWYSSGKKEVMDVFQ